ncbi:hypothetical protein [Streptomyces sp. MUSC 14]|uniref:hypothetical protein n=1 Tax=Streptomyces sp. MUSC 14 TaxID=1354889 RepID=UPI001160CF19|nr:hypothetical protein [Streptomyces sp. MUSC 14]
MDLQENVRGIERQIEQVRQPFAPEDPGEGDVGAVALVEAHTSGWSDAISVRRSVSYGMWPTTCTFAVIAVTRSAGHDHYMVY